MESGCGAGCLASNAESVSELKAAKLSSEHAILTAPLKSPSSNFDETLLARPCRESSSDLL